MSGPEELFVADINALTAENRGLRLLLDQAEARVAALTAALARYGGHEPMCAVAGGYDYPCNCGYQAALDAAGGA